MARVFLPDLGFRPAGVRLASSTAAPDLTLTRLVATDEGVDLAYELSHGVPDDDDTRTRESIVVRNAGQETQVTDGVVAVFSKDGVWRRSLRSKRVVPVAPGPVEVQVALANVGQWKVAGELVRFGDDAQSRAVDASETRDGITVRARSISFSRDLTAIEIDASVAEDGAIVAGIGAHSHIRLGPSAFTLRDQDLRAYSEIPLQPQHDNFPYDHETLAIFPAIEADAPRFELEIPFVFIDERYEQATFDVPVTAPRRIAFGRYPATVLRTYAIDALSRSGSPALGVDIDLGGWQGDRRVIAPWRIQLDGAYAGMTYLNRSDMRSPEPLQQFAIATDRPVDAKRVTLLGARVQVHGPWRIQFDR